MKHIHLILQVAIVATAMIASDAMAQDNNQGPKLFPLSEVRITEGQMRKLEDLSHHYLLTLDPDRLLSWFRREAGLTPLAQPYPLWESEDFQSTGPLAGHIMGFYLSGMSMMYQSTSDPAIIERLRYSIRGLQEAQNAGGDGYLAATRAGRHVFEDVVSGHFTTSNPMINDTWEPIYVMNKIMLGLYDAYTLCGIEEARPVLVKMADWFGVNVIDKIDYPTMQKLLVCEHGSINESFADVYRLTGDKRYLRWAERLNDDAMLVPLSEGRDILQGWHANTQIPKFTGFVSVGLADGEQRMLNAAKLFWDIVVRNHTWVNGGNSCGEHFFAEDEYINKVTAIGGPESCNSVNMMRLTEALYQVDGDIKRVDYYEQVLLNHILGNFDPEIGMSCYYTSMRPGHYKVYADPYNCFWCCVGTGLQAPAKLARMVYAYNADTLFVNMFVPTVLRWNERNVTLEQKTSYPDNNSTTMTIHADGRFKIAVRCPYWVKRGSVKLMINGKRHSFTQPKQGGGSYYIVIDRLWHDGDTVAMTFSPELYIQPLKKFNQYLSIQYGAMVMAEKIDNHGLTHDDFVRPDDHANPTAMKAIPESEVTTLVGTVDAIRRSIRRNHSDSLSLTMKVADPNRQVTLIPFTRIGFDRYEIYFPHVATMKEWTAKRSEQKDYSPTPEQLSRFRTIQTDSIIIGNTISESDHHMETYRSHSGQSFGQQWRDAYDGGFFMYQMKCSPESPMSLAVRYRQDDSGERTFDIQIEGHTIQTVNHNIAINGVETPLYYDEIEIPQSLTQGKSLITVKFNAHNHNLAGGIFDLRTLRRDH